MLQSRLGLAWLGSLAFGCNCVENAKLAFNLFAHLSTEESRDDSLKTLQPVISASFSTHLMDGRRNSKLDTLSSSRWCTFSFVIQVESCSLVLWRVSYGSVLNFTFVFLPCAFFPIHAIYMEICSLA